MSYSLLFHSNNGYANAPHSYVTRTMLVLCMGTRIVQADSGSDSDSESRNQWRTQDFFFGGVQQIQLRTEDRENGYLGAVAP